MRDKIKAVIDEMSEVAGLDKSFAEDFFKNIIEDRSVLNELFTYLQTGQFAGNEKVNGYSVVDVLVFQMDHFKAFLDRDTENSQNNECYMVLNTLDTFMKMKKNPEKYLREMTEESGSDYDGKF